MNTVVDNRVSAKTSPEVPAGVYAHRFQKKVMRINSSGRCNLTCPYCFTTMAKNGVSITRDDFAYLFDFFGEDIYMILTGAGDFFFGYSPRERLLEYILEHDVQVYLDINNVTIREFKDIPSANLEKIETIDISLHYSELQRRHLLDVWMKNLVTILKKYPKDSFIVKSILALDEVPLWNEIVQFYTQTVFRMTGKKMVLHCDEFDGRFGNPDIIRALDKFGQSCRDVADVVRVQPSSLARPGPCASKAAEPECILCPAGSRYFLIQNHGAILPCKEIWQQDRIELGNIKTRDVRPLSRPINCPGISNPNCMNGWRKRLPAWSKSF